MTQTATKTNATTHKGIETTGIEIVKESQRTARPQDLFLPCSPQMSRSLA